MFSWFEKLLKIVMIYSITCLENYVRLLGEHIGFHIQVLMAVLARVNTLQTMVFFSFFIQAVSSWSNKPVVDIALPKF